jgi:hypothetical protein
MTLPRFSLDGPASARSDPAHRTAQRVARAGTATSPPSSAALHLCGGKLSPGRRGRGFLFFDRHCDADRGGASHLSSKASYLNTE